MSSQYIVTPEENEAIGMAFERLPERQRRSLHSFLVRSGDHTRALQADLDAERARVEDLKKAVAELEAEIVSVHGGDDIAYALIRLAHKRAREVGDLPNDDGERA